MSIEIERKFLVVNDDFLASAKECHNIAQGYLSVDPDRTVRVRIFDKRGFITVKTRNKGASRHEWEFEIPVSDASEMLCACIRMLEKVRYIVDEPSGLRWEVDVFSGRLNGLRLAEIELPSEDTHFEKPSFLGDEVTDNPAYYNSNL